MPNKYISSAGIARIIGVSATTVSRSLSLIKGFPKPVPIKGNTRHYSIQAYNWWAKGKDVKQVVLAANRLKYQQDRAATSKSKVPRVNDHVTQLQIDFLRGKYAPGYAKERYAAKREYAAKYSRNPVRVVVSVESHW